MAVTVADEWQKHGLGTFLAQHLIDYAKLHGVRTLYSVDLADNDGMRRLAKDLGMTTRHDPEDAHQIIHSLNL